MSVQLVTWGRLFLRWSFVGPPAPRPRSARSAGAGSPDGDAAGAYIVTQKEDCTQFKIRWWG